MSFQGSIDYFFSTVIVQLTPKQIAARRRNYLKSAVWNPPPKFGLRVVAKVVNLGDGTA
jgi:hypothetical protein